MKLHVLMEEGNETKLHVLLMEEGNETTCTHGGR